MSTTRLPACALAAACGMLALTASPAATFPGAGDRLAPMSLATAAPGSALTPADLEQLISDARRGLARDHESAARARPARRLRLSQAGRAILPATAPARVKRLIRAGNRIAAKPYLWGGGHGSWKAPGYDCSGSVGYALHAAGVLDNSVTSGDLESYGRPGAGKWVTIYANGGHTYMVVAGLRFDTTAFKQTGSRWTRDVRDHGGYVVRHPAGM